MLGNPLCIKLCAVLNKIFEKFVFKLGGLVLLTGPGLFFLYPALSVSQRHLLEKKKIKRTKQKKTSGHGTAGISESGSG